MNPEIVKLNSQQATINIGTIGHVSHGKSTLVKAISSIDPIKFKSEKERNITIKLGYANAKIYKCDKCPRPQCYQSHPSKTRPKQLPCNQKDCQGTQHLQRQISFVDSPGHNALMSTMMSGVTVMDAAVLLIAGNTTCPQPQTMEHLAAIETMNLEQLIILQNKADLTTPDQLHQNHQQIKDFVKQTIAENSPIIPISAQLKLNTDVVCEYLAKLPIPERDLESPIRMNIIRSFDINKAGADDIEQLKGGVVGGAIIQGILKIGDDIEIKPGVITRDPKTNEIRCTPIRTKVISLFSETTRIKQAQPGGLIGIGTKIDPTLCKSDRLVGQLLGLADTLPPTFTKLQISYVLMRRIIGEELKEKSKNEKPKKIKKIEKGEVILVNVGSNTAKAKVIALKNDLAQIHLYPPICTEQDSRLGLSRQIDQSWRLIGWGKILQGK